MQELLRSNDLVLISRIEALLASVGIGVLVADQHMSVLEGGIGAFPRRLLVESDDVAAARRHLRDAGLAAYLPEGP